MLKAIVIGIAAAAVLAGPALAQTIRPPLPAPGGVAPLLVKHDKDEHGHGKKLGHYKQRWKGDDDDERWSSGSRTYIVPVPVYPPAYYGGPGYGSSVPPYYAPPY